MAAVFSYKPKNRPITRLRCRAEIRRQLSPRVPIDRSDRHASITPISMPTRSHPVLGWTPGIAAVCFGGRRFGRPARRPRIDLLETESAHGSLPMDLDQRRSGSQVGVALCVERSRRQLATDQRRAAATAGVQLPRRSRRRILVCNSHDRCPRQLIATPSRRAQRLDAAGAARDRRHGDAANREPVGPAP